MTVIVVRRDDDFSQQLRAAGLEVINLDIVGTKVLEDLSKFENVTSRLDAYDGVFFTSPVAAQIFVERVEPSLRPTLYVLGRRATKLLTEAGFAVKTIVDANTAEEMLTAFADCEFVEKKLLFVRGERSLRTIPRTFVGIADVDEVVVYGTVEIDPKENIAADIRERLASGEIDWICFFSPSAVEAFMKRFDTHNVSVAAIGETTAAAARELGFNVELVASRAANDVFASELIERVKSKGRV